jgi:halogenation protein CepH
MQFDVIVIGGGPAGSTVSTLLAMTGKRVLLLERDRFPRHQIGESLLPMTVHGICPLLGLKDELKAHGFPIKTGSTFRWGRSPDIWGFEFGELSILDETNAGYAHQVERSRFDYMLLRNAIKHGVDVRQGHTATGLEVEHGRVVGVRFKDPEGRDQVERARYTVSASGNASGLNSYVGDRIYSKFFRNVAMYGYFSGGKRLPAPHLWSNILSAAFDEGWFWYIPLSEDLTSVGVVIDKSHADRLRGDPDQAFQHFVDRCPVIRDFLAPAKRVRDGEYGEFRVRKDWSYTSSRFWRPGICMLGDAAAFVDPVFSQGVHLATYSALLAARSINTLLDRSDASEDQLMGEFEQRYRLEYGAFYNFLATFYNMDQDAEGYYWAARQFNRTEERDNDAFISLVAGVSSGEFFEVNRDAPRMMQNYIEHQERRTANAAHAAVWWDPAQLDAEELETRRLAICQGPLVPSRDRLYWAKA